jgi:predicted transposase YbfD/YdcC
MFTRSPEERMAANPSVASIKKHFRRLYDPRVGGRTKHLLIDLLVMALCGVIANCDDWPDIALFAQHRESWFRRFLRLPGGIPAHDTFERVFAALNPRALQACCLAWLREVAGLAGLEHIAIDGKSLRGSANGKLGALHVVSAWATEAHVSLGQVAVDGKGNEITAIPKLLELLDLHGALVTIDAIGCQKRIAKKIVDRGGDYVLVVKANQERLLSDIQATVTKALDGELPAGRVRQCTTRDSGHGRAEERHCVIIEDVSGIRDRTAWPHLRTIGMCHRERTVNGQTTTEVCYFIGSRRMAARRYAAALRNHWGIENNLHWQLDVSFHEDASRVENRHGAENLSLFRKLALSLLKQNPRQESMARKRKAAAVDPGYLAEILAGATKPEKV